jgi:hypothetical protein
MTKIMAQQHNSQIAIGRRLGAAAAVASAAGSVIAVGKDTLVPVWFLPRQWSK